MWYDVIWYDRTGIILENAFLTECRILIVSTVDIYDVLCHQIYWQSYLKLFPPRAIKREKLPTQANLTNRTPVHRQCGSNRSDYRLYYQSGVSGLWWAKWKNEIKLKLLLRSKNIRERKLWAETVMRHLWKINVENSKISKKWVCKNKLW